VALQGTKDSQISEQSWDIIERTKALIDDARRNEITVRVLGGIAVLIHAHAPLPPALLREVRDADLVVEKGKVKQFAKLLREKGYDENRRFNLLNGSERLIFFDPKNQTQLDVFVGEFRMCHRLSFGARLGVDQYTLPLAETLLTKLQIVQLNDKDMKDILLVFFQHETATATDGESINLAEFARRCASDWGLYRTAVDNLQGALERLRVISLEPTDSGVVAARVRATMDAVEQCPKSSGWKLRALVGTRVRWYELPEEVTGAIDVVSL
jgi:hypothetical protein